MKNVLCIGAHYDDIEIGMGGTCLRLIDEGCDIHVVTVCNIDVPNRPAACESRCEVLKENIEELGVKSATYLEYPSNNLQHCDENHIIGAINKVISDNDIDTIFTQNITDINIDHQVVSRAARVCARPRIDNPVQQLYEYYIPGSSEWSFTGTKPTVAFDISPYFDTKIKMISRYITEIRPSPDPCSLAKIKSRDEYLGGIFGYDKAEVFNLVFKRFK